MCMIIESADAGVEKAPTKKICPQSTRTGVQEALTKKICLITASAGTGVYA